MRKRRKAEQVRQTAVVSQCFPYRDSISPGRAVAVLYNCRRHQRSKLATAKEIYRANETISNHTNPGTIG